MADTVCSCCSIPVELEELRHCRAIGDMGLLREAIDVTADGDAEKGETLPALEVFDAHGGLEAGVENFRAFVGAY